MNVDSEKITRTTIEYVRSYFHQENTGHDWWHTYRVHRLALNISSREGGNRLIIEMSALLHDIGDYKLFNGDEEAGETVLKEYLYSLSLPLQMINQIIYITTHISFMKTFEDNYGLENGKRIPTSLEYKIVSDADRLDAMGAIGIARTFTYGGYYHRPIYDPNTPPMIEMSQEEYKKTEGPSINHFYEKLLKLKDMMNTSYGKEMAINRHDFLLKYLKQFYAEWEGIK